MVWRAAIGTLRANRRLSYYYLFATFYTAQSFGIALRGRGTLPILAVAFWGLAWSFFLRIAPAHRELLRLPLATREAATVLFILRVLLPCACALLLIPLFGQLFTRGSHGARELLELACGLCAAFPLMVFAPFLPLPRHWREVGVTRESCADPALQWLAAAAAWVLAPLITVIPLVSMRAGFAQWPWVSAALALGLAWSVWSQRERLAVAVPSSDHAGRRAGRATGARWQGWSGLVPLLWPLFGACCALGLAIGLSLTLPWVPGAMITMVITLIALGTSLSARQTVNCARVLRLLPISPSRLSLLLLAMLVVPTLCGCLFGATLAHVLHPERLSIAQVELFCMLSLTGNAVVFVLALRTGRLKPIGPRLAASAAVQVACVLGGLYFGIALPSGGWLFAACLGALLMCFWWLRWNVRFHALRAGAAAVLLLYACLPVLGDVAMTPDAALRIGFTGLRSSPH
jgi:hypothetical protein